MPPLSAEEALDLHDRMARHTLRRAQALQATGEARVEVRTDAAFSRVAHEWLGGGFLSRYQGEGDLGDRIRLAFGDAFGRGERRVVVVGTDCPRLTSAQLRETFDRLERADVVLGPATDGGYYLVGLRKESAKRSVPVLFSGVPWSTAEVLERTLAIADERGLTCALLEMLPDVDRPEDLPDAELALARSVLSTDATVSVVIPALDDEEFVTAAVRSALNAGAHEVIVADGGSVDASRRAAAAAGARVITCDPGRARQMNAGAAAATGSILLFLHADTLLPADACALAREALATPRTVAGAFGFAVTAGARNAALITLVGGLRSRLSGTPFGDQALFMPADTFWNLGGYPDLPTMEDLELVTRLRRLGKVRQLRPRAVTSARAWTEHGLLRTTAVNQIAIIAYRMGMDPSSIARWRRSIAPPREHTDHDARP